MAKLIDIAFTEVSRLPEDEQESVARWLLAELASERRWDKTLSKSKDRLASMANEAVAEYREGRTRVLNPEEL